MDECGWEKLRPWLSARAELPVGPLFYIIDGATRGRPWATAAVRGTRWQARLVLFREHACRGR
jgi:hypothetical protein